MQQHPKLHNAYICAPPPPGVKWDGKYTTVFLSGEGHGEEWDFETGEIHIHHEWDKMVSLSDGEYRVSLRINL